MENNKTFFKDAKNGTLSLGELFSETMKRHSAEDTAKVLTAGTVLTTPEERDMLADWQRPFLFARFFLGWVGVLLLAFLMASLVGFTGGYYLLMVGIPFLVPTTILLLVYEMNVPRNISLYDVIKAATLGGVLSILAAAIINYYTDDYMAVWAGAVEEPAKLLVIYLILSRKNYKYALNGALIGAAVGTGFAVMESLMYVIASAGEGVYIWLEIWNADNMTLVDVLESYGTVWIDAVFYALYVAVARAVTAVSGHGIFAALYGSALVKAKGDEEIRLAHLFNPGFLVYFAVSILLHALHNYDLNLGLPVLLGGNLKSEYIIIAIIAFALLLSTLHTGVNQAVARALSLNGDRYTIAVDRDKREDLEKRQHNAGAVAYKDFKLKCISGPYAGKKFRCANDQAFTIGRDSRSNAIAVPECKYVGTVHCRIEASNGRLYITDLSSRNGTYLDGQRLSANQPIHALNASVLQLGNEDCRFQVIIE